MNGNETESKDTRAKRTPILPRTSGNVDDQGLRKERETVVPLTANGKPPTAAKKKVAAGAAPVTKRSAGVQSKSVTGTGRGKGPPPGASLSTQGASAKKGASVGPRTQQATSSRNGVTRRARRRRPRTEGATSSVATQSNSVAPTSRAKNSVGASRPKEQTARSGIPLPVGVGLASCVVGRIDSTIPLLAGVGSTSYVAGRFGSSNPLAQGIGSSNLIAQEISSANHTTLNVASTGGNGAPGDEMPEVISDVNMGSVYHQLWEADLHPKKIGGLYVVGPEDCGEIRVGTRKRVVFTVVNDSEVDRELQSYRPFIPDPFVEAVSMCPCAVPRHSNSTQLIVSLNGSSSQAILNFICFNFDDGTKLYHKIHLIITSDIVEFLAPDSDGYTPRREHPGDYITRLDKAIDGEKPPCPPPTLVVTRSSTFKVPPELRGSAVQFSFPYLEQPLDLATYSTRFDVLLWLEELGKEKDVRQYDMSSVSLVKENGYLCLAVPGLAKSKQQVIIGDKLIFSRFKQEESSDEPEESTKEKKGERQIPSHPFAYDGEHYSAYVHQICLDDEVLKLKFKSWFHESEELCSREYEVMFTVNRATLVRMHQALDIAEVIGNEVLFPTTKPPTRPSLEFASQNLQFIDQKLNAQQKRAVKAIVQGACRPIPYILFGPPGTGKTSTVVESILQIYKCMPLCKILACAPSNSAADLLIERLHSSRCITDGSMIRLNAASRSNELPRTIEEYCVSVKDRTAREKARNSRIVVCTCSTAATLDPNLMVFSYVFVDEAGHALEPECLIPVTLLDADSGQLVLAGDPLQLGPVVFSSLASQKGLSTSMLERLMGRDLYKRDTTVYAATGNYDSMLVTKLVENYRSHQTLLKLYSDQFYDGELVEKADRRITHRLCNWEHLPSNGVPLLFYGIQGLEKRDRASPSWFNPFEAEQVLFYTRSLVLSHTVLQSDIGIITPYSKQVEKIKMLLDREGLGNVKVGSVEEFQGQEYLVIIISTVRSKKLGFVSNPKRFNVAISRARALLIVVGNPYLLAQDPCWSKLIQYAQDHQCYTQCPPL